MEETTKTLGEIDRVLAEIKTRQDKILDTIRRLDKTDNETIGEVAALLREQARNNLETSKLLNDLSSEVAGLAFRIEELESWKRLVSGNKSIDWIAENRAEQSRMCYRAIKDGFNDVEFMELIMNLSISQSDVAGESISEKAIWLVEYSRRNGSFWKLVNEIRAMRPHALLPVDTGRLGYGL